MGLDRLTDTFRHLAGPPADGPTDRELLAAVAAGDRTQAFGRLVERHGPMVLGVCKRVTGDHHAAEDAFQATFLVLAKKADAAGWQDSVANWLHGVAYRTAMRARSQAARSRKRPPDPIDPPTAPPPSDAAGWNELRGIVDAEVAKLPENLRVPVLLCCLHDRTVEEAAAVLRLPASTVKGRLQQGRDLLRQRLARRGVGVGAGVLGMFSAGGTASAVPAALLHSTTILAAVGSGSGLVATLTREELRMLLFRKLTLAGVGVGCAVVAAGLGLSGPSSTAAPLPPKPWKDGPVTAATSRPKASEPVVKDELEVTVRPTKAVFGPDEVPELEVAFAHKPATPPKTGHSEPLATTYLPGDIRWELTRDDGPGVWAPAAREFRRRVPSGFHVFAVDGGTRVEFVLNDVLAGPFTIDGGSDKPRFALMPGKYKAVGTFTLGEQGGRVVRGRVPDPEEPKLWAGKITTKPVEITIADKPPEGQLTPVVVRKESNGKVVAAKVGQRVVVELENVDVTGGWERSGPAAAGLPAAGTTFATRSFAAGGSEDLRFGTYRFEYVATAAGDVELAFDHAVPAAPWKIERDGTKIVERFAVTISVAK